MSSFLTKITGFQMHTEVVSNEKELHAWRQKIEAAWNKSVASVIEVGKLIKEAKENLGVSYTLLETELPFSSTVAAFLVKIAEHPVLSNPTYYPKLPNSYNTLYHLAKVGEKQLIKQIESGEITPDYTLRSAKSLGETVPRVAKASDAAASPKAKSTMYEVGTISISTPTLLDNFEVELAALLEKYKGEITLTKRESSLAEWHREQLYAQALEKIAKSESEFKNITLDQMRMLEDAAHFLQRDKSQKHRREIVINGELVLRTCLPNDYKDIKAVQRLLGQKDITRAVLKNWCIENKVPNQFTELKSMDKELYIWEQVRLITEKKDVRGGLKRLKDLASRSTIPKIKAQAQKALSEVTRFDRKV